MFLELFHLLSSPLSSSSSTAFLQWWWILVALITFALYMAFILLNLSMTFRFAKRVWFETAQWAEGMAIKQTLSHIHKYWQKIPQESNVFAFPFISVAVSVIHASTSDFAKWWRNAGKYDNIMKYWAFNVICTRCTVGKHNYGHQCTGARWSQIISVYFTFWNYLNCSQKYGIIKIFNVFLGKSLCAARLHLFVKNTVKQ